MRRRRAAQLKVLLADFENEMVAFELVQRKVWDLASSKIEESFDQNRFVWVVIEETAPLIYSGVASQVWG
jgi:hypothetical protein